MNCCKEVNHLMLLAVWALVKVANQIWKRLFGQFETMICYHSDFQWGETETSTSEDNFDLYLYLFTVFQCSSVQASLSLEPLDMKEIFRESDVAAEPSSAPRRADAIDGLGGECGNILDLSLSLGRLSGPETNILRVKYGSMGAIFLICGQHIVRTWERICAKETNCGANGDRRQAPLYSNRANISFVYIQLNASTEHTVFTQNFISHIMNDLCRNRLRLKVSCWALQLNHLFREMFAYVSSRVSALSLLETTILSKSPESLSFKLLGTIFLV